jgi:alpha-D-ribose 1-methylphosphonate 5-triphosphate synthase subunit PhnH
MPVAPALQPAFRDAVRDSQSVFRLALGAAAAPGRIHDLPLQLAAPAPLHAPAAALLLTLCDFETAVWLDPPLTQGAGVVEFLRFHTGARIVASPADADFAAIADATSMPALAQFRQGTPEYPDRSATLIVQVESLTARGWKLEGPGIRDMATFSAAPLQVDFARQLGRNRSAFPCGVDIFFATRDKLAALPRSTSVTEAG